MGSGLGPVAMEKAWPSIGELYATVKHNESWMGSKIAFAKASAGDNAFLLCFQGTLSMHQNKNKNKKTASNQDAFGTLAEKMGAVGRLGKIKNASLLNNAFHSSGPTHTQNGL